MAFPDSTSVGAYLADHRRVQWLFTETGGQPNRSIRQPAGTHDEDHRRAEWPQCFPGQDIAAIEAWDIVCREINAFSPHDSKQRRSSEAAADVVH